MRVPVPVPERLARNILEMRGAEGAKWLTELPELIADCGQLWRLTVGAPFPGLSYNYATPAVRAGGMSTVLKLSFPGDREFETEVEALRLFDGRGAVRLLEADVQRGVMLLERLEPGLPLTTVENDEEATSIAADVMKRLWRPVPPDHPFPAVSDWAEGFSRMRRRFGGGTGPMPAALVEKAESLFADLLCSGAEPVLLHGDLHHGNVLAAQHGSWLAIDPKGVVGEPAFDTAALLHNPSNLLKSPHPAQVLERRVSRLTEELNIDRDRVLGWGIAQAVVSAYWNLEDHGRVWKEALIFSELLSEIETRP